MTPREIRNLKGEIVQDTDDEREWYHFSASTWMLIGGLVLFNLGCFFGLDIIEGLFRLLDFRLWPWWYFAVLLVIAAFSIRWYLLFQAWDELDPVDSEVAAKFLRMSITMTAEMLLVVLLNATGFIHYFYYPISQWLAYGAYSHMAAFTFLLICAAIIATIYVVKEWCIAAFAPP